MAAADLSLETLGELDEGRARAIIDEAIRHVVADTFDRGDDGKARQVVITLSLEKMDGGQIVASVTAQTKSPAKRTHNTVGMIGHRAGEPIVQFQLFDRNEPRQRTIDEPMDANRGPNDEGEGD